MSIKEENMIRVLSGEVEETLREGMERDHFLKSAKSVKMEEVREENERLKSTISQMMKDYRSLQLHLHDKVRQDQPQKFRDSSPLTASSDGSDKSELVSLSLGRLSDDSERKRKKNDHEHYVHRQDRKLDDLELRLACQVSNINPSPENSSDGSKEGTNKTSHKTPKTARSGDNEEEILEQNPLKKPRVCVRAVCNTQTMNDGCQWRKYGQKTAKGNPCPRAYYRCTGSSSCPVRKQAQRSAEDMSVLNTTYEGTHDHPLPPSATAMASATTAAAAMLNCGSTSSSQPGRAVSACAHPGFNSSFPRASISTSQSHPTLVLDFTAPKHTSPSPYNYASSSSPYIGFFSTMQPVKNPTGGAYSEPQAKYIYDNIQGSQKEIVRDEVAAAAKAITRNPSFQSALVAAVASLVGNGGISNSLDKERISGQSIKLGGSTNFSQPFVASGTIGLPRAM